MRKILHTPFVLAALLGAAATWASTENAATPKEAEAMVKKAVAMVKTSGKDKVIAAIIDHDNKDFHDRDLYLAAHSMDGTCLAHGTNEKMVGKNFTEMRDGDGKEYIKERMALARTKTGGFWTDYKFTNPLTKKIEPKATYCERADDLVICGGVYKK